MLHFEAHQRTKRNPSDGRRTWQQINTRSIIILRYNTSHVLPSVQQPNLKQKVSMIESFTGSFSSQDRYSNEERLRSNDIRVVYIDLTGMLEIPFFPVSTSPRRMRTKRTDGVPVTTTLSNLCRRGSNVVNNHNRLKSRSSKRQQEAIWWKALFRPSEDSRHLWQSTM